MIGIWSRSDIQTEYDRAAGSAAGSRGRSQSASTCTGCHTQSKQRTHTETDWRKGHVRGEWLKREKNKAMMEAVDIFKKKNWKKVPVK